MSKSPKQMPNCLQRAETIVILIIFNGVLCDVHVNTVTGFFFTVTLHKLGIRKALLDP
jgi:hypothetical protein